MSGNTQKKQKKSYEAIMRDHAALADQNQKLINVVNFLSSAVNWFLKKQFPEQFTNDAGLFEQFNQHLTAERARQALDSYIPPDEAVVEETPNENTGS